MPCLLSLSTLPPPELWEASNTFMWTATLPISYLTIKLYPNPCQTATHGHYSGIKAMYTNRKFWLQQEETGRSPMKVLDMGENIFSLGREFQGSGHMKLKGGVCILSRPVLGPGCGRGVGRIQLSKALCPGQEALLLGSQPGPIICHQNISTSLTYSNCPK